MTGKMNKFLAFCEEHDLVQNTQETSVMPKINPSVMTHYAAWLYDDKGITTYNSLNTYLSAVNSWCKANGLPRPTIDPKTHQTDYEYDSVRKAIQKRMGTAVTNRMPITRYHMNALITQNRATPVFTPRQSTNY